MMMNPTDLDAQINAEHTQSQQQQVQSAPKSFWQRNWPRVFILLSLAVAVLTFAGVILNFIKIVIKPNVTLLNIYCLVFSLLALSAELRQFRWFRKISYHWMKYVYFLTYYKPRGIFYIVLGLLLLGDMAILYAAGAVSMFVGVVILVTSFLVGLPVYDDPQERKREQEEARRYYEGRNAKPAGFFATHLGVKEQNPNADNSNANTLEGDDVALQQQQQQYQPPTLPLREGGQADLAASPPLQNSPGSPDSKAYAEKYSTFSTASSTHALKESGGGGKGWGGASGSSDGAEPTGKGPGTIPGAAMFGGDSPAAAATTMARQGSADGATGASQLRRDFAAAMDDGESLR